MADAMIVVDVPGRSPSRHYGPKNWRPVIVRPGDATHAEGVPVSVPQAWLPTRPVPRHPEWYAAHRLGIAAASLIAKGWDHFWVCESDVFGTPDVWSRLMDATAASDADLLAGHIIGRRGIPAWDEKWFTAADCREMDSHYCLPALFRVSRRAVEWLSQDAEADREVFTNIALPSCVARHGGSLVDLNAFGRFYTIDTFWNRWRGPDDPDLLHHPIR